MDYLVIEYPPTLDVTELESAVLRPLVINRRVSTSHCLITTLPQKYWDCLASFTFSNCLKSDDSPSVSFMQSVSSTALYWAVWTELDFSSVCVFVSVCSVPPQLFVSLFLLQSVAAITASRGAPAASALRPSGSIRHPCPGVAPRGWHSLTVLGKQAGLRPLTCSDLS